MIVINFKTYPQATGEKAVELAKLCEKISNKTKVDFILGLQAADIFRVSSQVKIPVFAQHLDPFPPGRNTGFTLAPGLKQAGTKGVFLNHSEHPFQSLDDVFKAIEIAKVEGLQTLVFSKDVKTSIAIDKHSPDYIALEEPSLVSGDTAMIEFPDLKQEILKFSQSIKSVPLIGAGIKTKKDIEESLKLGVKGIAVASGVIKVDDPEKVLLEFASSF
ncbi:triose-phosphate isomerase [Patescibacteria group bacterium]